MTRRDAIWPDGEIESEFQTYRTRVLSSAADHTERRIRGRSFGFAWRRDLAMFRLPCHGRILFELLFNAPLR